MCDIVGVGAAVYDTLLVIDSYPLEDTKIIVKKTIQSGGGPCATGLVAASKLGAKCGYMGVLSDDAGGRFLHDDFLKYNVDIHNIILMKGYTSFSSYILINEEKSTRTCVVDRGNLPDLCIDESQEQAIKSAKILMVDGNEISAALEAAKVAKQNGTKVLYDAGGLYDRIDELLPYSDYLIPSEEFAIKYTGINDVESAARKLYSLFHPEIVVVTRGKYGGILYDGRNMMSYPAWDVKVVDSNGAGDVFHGAYAYAQVQDFDHLKSCMFASGVSALKCTKLGAREGVPSYQETIEFLRGYGYNEL